MRNTDKSGEDEIMGNGSTVTKKELRVPFW